ncbi:MAG: hypothetical protein ACRDNW_01225 [Trebonia sp.]
MGREFLPPEDAGSWGEFHARLELEQDGTGSRLTPLWWGGAGVLFAVMLFTCAYAFQDRHWWLWVCWLSLLGILCVMSARAAARADRRRARAAELATLHDAWVEHLERRPPTR